MSISSIKVFVSVLLFLIFVLAMESIFYKENRSSLGHFGLRRAIPSYNVIHTYAEDTQQRKGLFESR